MDEKAAVEALDIYRGPIVGTHGNCLSLMPNTDSNRHFSDRILEGIIERDGVAGVVPYNPYLKVGWTVGKNKREEVSFRHVADHLDHICQIGVPTQELAQFTAALDCTCRERHCRPANLISLLQARLF
jgi:membrane dipeptidase